MNYELSLTAKNGARVELLLNATTRRNAKGVVTGVVGVAQDITARTLLNATRIVCLSHPVA